MLASTACIPLSMHFQRSRCQLHCGGILSLRLLMCMQSCNITMGTHFMLSESDLLVLRMLAMPWCCSAADASLCIPGLQVVPWANSCHLPNDLPSVAGPARVDSMLRVHLLPRLAPRASSCSRGTSVGRARLAAGAPCIHAGSQPACAGPVPSALWLREPCPWRWVA